MVIQTFNNKKGLIHGSDPTRISCELGGVLRIGATEISISPEGESVMPVLKNGCDGSYRASFTDRNGDVYELERLTIRRGRIVPPSRETVELMELRCGLEALIERCNSLEAQIEILSHVFDTNSLNFLINKGED